MVMIVWKRNVLIITEKKFQKLMWLPKTTKEIKVNNKLKKDRYNKELVLKNVKKMKYNYRALGQHWERGSVVSVTQVLLCSEEMWLSSKFLLSALTNLASKFSAGTWTVP